MNDLEYNHRRAYRRERWLFWTLPLAIAAAQRGEKVMIASPDVASAKQAMKDVKWILGGRR